MEENISELQLLLYPTSDEIPDSAWNVFPPNGTYIKKTVTYAGYSTRQSIGMLQKEGEMKNMFAFIRDMAEDMDENERKELLGVFHIVIFL